MSDADSLNTQMSVAEANLAVLDAITSTLLWLLTEHGDEEDGSADEEVVKDMQNLADMIITDLNLTVVDVREDGTVVAEIRPVGDDGDADE